MNINIHYNYTKKDDQVSSHNSQINAFCTALKHRNAQYNFVNYLQKFYLPLTLLQILIIVFFLKHLTKADNFLCFMSDS